MNAAKILPGEYFVTEQDVVLITLLGSCVAACVRDAEMRIGGMNHFLLPDSHGQDPTGAAPARYGAYAMEVMINQLVKMGARRHRLQAKVFGGANVLRGLNERNVGARNSEFVVDFLRVEGIPLMAHDLGGNQARKVAYFPATGEARVKRLATQTPATLLETEQQYRRRVSSGPTAGSVELFD
jgi:chemotaxis protein CheD